MKAFKYIFLFLLLIIASNQCLISQDISKQKLKLAKSYEDSGDYDNATRIYQEVLDTRPDLENAFEGIARIYLTQNKFSELLMLVNSYAEKNPSSKMYALWGELLWKTGNNQQANDKWDEAINLFASDEKVFENIADAQTKLQLFEKAIETFLKARKNFDKPMMYANKLSRLYVATSNYQKGTQEALNLVTIHNNIGLATGRLYALMAGDKPKEYIKHILEEKVSNNPNDLLLLKLSAWFFREVKNYQHSLDTYIKIDKLTKGNGREIINFANQSKYDGQYEIALKAFAIIIDLGNSNNYFSTALYGYANTLELLMRQTKQINQKQIDEIIKRYRNIIKTFPNSSMAADGIFRIGFLTYEQLNKPQLAKTELNKLVYSSRLGHLKIAAKASNMIGKIFLSDNQIDSAIKIYKHVLKKYKKTAPDQCDKASFKLAELNYFQGNFDKAKEQYSILASNIDKDIANDALKRILFLSINKKDSLNLIKYAQAEFCLEQLDYKKAISQLSELLNTDADSELSAFALKKIAETYQIDNKPNKALESWQQYLKQFPKHIHNDFALIQVGQLLMDEQKYQEAEDSFKSILTKHSKSIYIDQARKSILKIRKFKKIKDRKP